MTLLTWPLRVLAFLGWYLREFVRANLSVTWDILTPTHLSSPHVVAYDTRCRTEFEVSLLSLLITLTPGTLVLATEQVGTELDTAAGAQGPENMPPSAPVSYRLYVHSMFDDDPASVRESTAVMEYRMLTAARPRDGAPARSKETRS